MAQVILLKDVAQLGSKGDVVDVTKGYLRNFLLPRKLASHATDAAIAAATKRMQEEERQKREAIERSQENAVTLGRTVLTIEQQAGEDGRLFGSVTAQDIADAIKDARGIKVDKAAVRLPEAIKTVGTHMVEVEVPGGAIATLKTMVTAKA
ncbi:MAG: 50S ribosomal protein L9 [Solirubrobacteraceae bacterium]|nr:50S ribosomal protein L9 [Solirubrobacteraceae bacterium]